MRTSYTYVFGTSLGQYPLTNILTDSLLKNKVLFFIYNDTAINTNVPQDVVTGTFDFTSFGTPLQGHVLTVFFENAV